MTARQPFQSALIASAAEDNPTPVRIGFAGLGERGVQMLGYALDIPGVRVPAVWSGRADAAGGVAEEMAGKGHPRPECYGDGRDGYRKMAERDDLDAVFIATAWEDHAPMAVTALGCGKYVALEVPAALTIDECWDLVRASQQAGMPCMMMENWSFRRDNLAVLKMIRAGLFGEIVHCHCAHSHNCVEWYMPRPWIREHLLSRCADQYATHSLGPVLSWMDINCGDRFETLVSMASGQWGISDQLSRRGDPDADLPWMQGDVVTTLVRTARGKTVVINMDMQLPRPYDNRWTIQGTRGIYNEQREAVYLAGDGPEINPEQWSDFAPYQDEYDHSWWRGKESPGGRFGLEGHGGVDPLELLLFVQAVRHGTQTPIDVYDSVVMSSILPLSEASIAAGSQSVPLPDFTSGAWETRKPTFAVE